MDSINQTALMDSLNQTAIMEVEDYEFNSFLFWLGLFGYDDVDILPSSSLLNKSYPEFYGYHTLS